MVEGVGDEPGRRNQTGKENKADAQRRCAGKILEGVLGSEALLKTPGASNTKDCFSLVNLFPIYNRCWLQISVSVIFQQRSSGEEKRHRWGCSALILLWFSDSLYNCVIAAGVWCDVLGDLMTFVVVWWQEKAQSYLGLITLFSLALHHAGSLAWCNWCC